MNKKSWDCYEVVQLINCFFKTKKCTTTKEKREVLMNLSSMLRQYAMAQGLEIDEKYRNLNGMILQLSHMEYLITNGKSGLSGSPKMFTEMFELYQTNRTEYEKILRKANELMGGTDTEIGQKEQFTSWLSEKYDLNRISEIFLTLSDVEDCLQKKNLLFGSIYEVSSEREVKKMFVSLKENKMFKISHIRKLQNIESSMNSYLLFLKSKKKIDEQPKREIFLEDRCLDDKTMGEEEKQIVVNEDQEEKLMTASERKNDFFDWLKQKEGMAEASCRSYVSAVGGAEQFATEQNLDSTQLYETGDYLVASKTVDVLLQNDDFIEHNIRQHNRFRAALSKYLGYLSAEYKSSSVKNNEDTIELEPFKSILMEKYPKGFRIQSGIEMKKFRHFWSEKYGTELEAEDDTVRRYISRAGIQYQEFVYLPEAMLSDSSEKSLITYIDKTFAEGKKAIYYDALFKEFSVEFLGQRINNSNMLKIYLSYFYQGQYFFNRSYMASDRNVEVDPIDEVRDYLKSYGAPMKLTELYEALSHIPQRKIKQVLNFNKEFIYNATEEYFHADVIDFSNAELDNISDMIQQAIDDKEFISGNELIQAITAKYPIVMERFTMFTMVGLRDAIGYKLIGTYSFTGNIISSIDKRLSMYDVFADYCRHREHVTLNELNSLKVELNTVIYFDAVYANSLRISQDEFVSKDRAQFNIAATDAAIERYCTENYISLGEFVQFGTFPDAGFPWNSYLLEHYVSDYSNDYELMHTSFNAYNCVGAIVKRDSGIEDFNDLITHVLADSNIQLSKESALEYLCDYGYMARRRYTGIEQIITSANGLRTQKGQK